MADPGTITTLLIAAATAVGTETVKEATKDVYRALKGKVGELFGPRASRAVAKLENDGTREEGTAELRNIVGDTLEPDEATQILPLAEAMIRALNEDTAAKQFVHSLAGRPQTCNAKGCRELHREPARAAARNNAGWASTTAQSR